MTRRGVKFLYNHLDNRPRRCDYRLGVVGSFEGYDTSCRETCRRHLEQGGVSGRKKESELHSQREPASKTRCKKEHNHDDSIGIRASADIGDRRTWISSSDVEDRSSSAADIED